MQTNANMTLYSRSVVSGSEVYTRQAINGVHWETIDGITKNRDGFLKENKVNVFIPFSVGELSIKAGDVLVKGTVSDSISSSFTISDLKRKYGNAVVVVANVAIRDFGSAQMQHWQVGAS